MVRIIEGSVFDSNCQVLVNPVNTSGVMGRGVSLEFKRRYPSMFLRYREACLRGKLYPGRLWLLPEDDHDILLLPIKNDWTSQPRMDYIEEGLLSFVKIWQQWGIKSAAFPLLGTGVNGLDPAAVLRVMCDILDPMPVLVEIYLSDDEVNLLGSARK